MDYNIKFNLPEPTLVKEEWDKHGMFELTNLFGESANTIWEYYFYDDVPWDLAVYPDLVEHKEYYIPYIKKDAPDLQKRINHIYNVRNQEGFSYCYERNDNHFHPLIENLFFNPKFFDYISKCTGYKNTNLNPENCFTSRYSSGHYNGVHTDGPNGRIAFVYHLSKDWGVQDGGLFCKLDWDHNLIKAIVPPFDSLVVFDTVLNGKPGNPHMVTEVSQGCNNKRIGFTGWFD